MKNQILGALVGGFVIPMVLLMLVSGLDSPVDTTEPTAEYPEQTQTQEQRTLAVLTDNGVQQMELEEYLAGVVLAEMPADFEEEALKAQAVVARTYTCKRMDAGKHDSAAVCTDSTCCQGYITPEGYLDQGGSQDSVEKVRRAVADTAGLVLTYKGALIDATYFSCSGGSTEDAVAVWGQDVPYLQAVESPGEEAAPRYSETVTFTAAEFAKLTGCGGSGNPVGWITDVTYTNGGGVDTMVICGKTYTGVELRQKLGLRSTAFSVSISGTTITIETHGSGHRVGMSQYGAQAMAQAGSSYGEILAHYYQGTQLEMMGTQ